MTKHYQSQPCYLHALILSTHDTIYINYRWCACPFAIHYGKVRRQARGNAYLVYMPNRYKKSTFVTVANVNQTSGFVSLSLEEPLSILFQQCRFWAMWLQFGPIALSRSSLHRLFRSVCSHVGIYIYI